MDRHAYPSDLTDTQWANLADLIPAPKQGPQEVKYERREIVNAMLYQKRTGCQWRFLPHDLPPWSIVKKYYYQWRDDRDVRAHSWTCSAPAFGWPRDATRNRRSALLTAKA